MASLFGAETTYPTQSRIRTTGTTGLPGPGGGGGGGGFGLGGVMRKRAGQLLTRGGLENQAMRFQLEEAQRASQRARAPKLEAWDSQTGLEGFSRRHQMRQMGAQTRMLEGQEKAMSGAVPTRMMFGPGVIPGRTTDPLAMSGHQRQAFLPQGSQEIGVMPSPSAAFGAQRAAVGGQQAGELDAISRLYGMQQAGFAPGGGAVNWGWAGPQSPTGRAQRQSTIQDQYELWRQQAASGLGR